MKKLFILFLSIFFSGQLLISQNGLSQLRINDPAKSREINNDSIFPPSNLQAQVNNNDVFLTWMPSEDGPGQWLSYSDTTLFTLIGLTEGGTWRIAARWEPSQIEQFDGEFLTKVEFIPGSDSAAYTLKVWKGEFAETLIYEQEIVDFNILEWNKILLQSPVLIDVTEELWVGIEIDQPAEVYPIGNDFGPAVAWYGDLISFENDEWVSATDFGLDYNWTLRAFVTQSNDPLNSFSELENTRKTTTIRSFPDAFNVYRDDELLTEIAVPDLQYIDTEVENGIYNYGVTAIYDTVESEPATVLVQVGGPVLNILPDSLVISAQSGEIIEDQIRLVNTGSELLEWSISEFADWIVFDTLAGQIAAGDSAQLGFSINTSDFEAGFYSSLIEFEINNINNPVSFLLVNLFITGDPSIELIPDTLDFGNVLVNNPSNQQFALMNTGTDLLAITSFESSNEAFFVFNDGYFLSPGEMVFINVEFLPIELIDYSGTITINSNDPENPISTVYLSGSGSLAPPLNLQGTMVDQVAELTWLDPTGGPGTWMYYGTGVNSSAIGIIDGAVWQIAARWEPNQLNDFAGEYISKSRFYYFSGISDYTFKIWTVDSLPELVYSQFIGLPDSSSWNEIILDEPFFIDGETELLIGYEINQEVNSFPAGIDVGPSIYGYGDLVSLDGITWEYLADYGLDVNWSIQAFVAGEEGFMQIPRTDASIKNSENELFQIADAKEINEGTRASVSDFIGYNVYRDGNLLNSETYQENSYFDTLTSAGTYSYSVTAVYDEGESPAAGPVTFTVDSVEFLLPQNWQMTETNIKHQIMIPSNISNHEDNVLLPGDYVGVFFTHDEEMVLAGMIYWESFDSEFEAFGDHNLTPEKDGFHDGDSLTWVIFRPADEKEYLVEAIYDQSMPEHDGTFKENGLSALKALKINALSINEELFNDLVIYPVPASDFLHITGLPAGSTIKLLSSDGRITINLFSSKNTERLNISSLPGGIYLLYIEHKEGNYVKKLLVK